MQREWEPADLIGAWTLLDRDWQMVGNKTGPTRLGSALMLKFYEIEDRFGLPGGGAARRGTAG